MIDARNFWGTTYRDICAGYGAHWLGYLSYWRITYALVQRQALLAA